MLLFVRRRSRALPDKLNLPRHHRTIQYRPERAPDSKAASIDHGEGNMIDSADPCGEAYKDSSDTVSNPDTDPRLPPGQARLKRRGRDHPSIHIVGICRPEANEVTATPLSSCWLDGLQILVDEEKLLVA